jgi:protein-tyrosine phosphatase
MSVVLAFGGRAGRRPSRHRQAPHDLFSGLPASVPEPRAGIWWPAPGRLAAGPCPGGADGLSAREELASLAAAGVRHLIDLAEAHEHASYHALLPALSLSLPRPIAWERHAIPEGGVPGVAQLNHILDRIDALIAVDAMPCVHGQDGRGRTVLVAACWRVRHGESPRDALVQAAGAWRAAQTRRQDGEGPETLEQRRFVHDWARHDRLRSPRGAARCG